MPATPANYLELWQNAIRASSFTKPESRPTKLGGRIWLTCSDCNTRAHRTYYSLLHHGCQLCNQAIGAEKASAIAAANRISERSARRPKYEQAALKQLRGEHSKLFSRFSVKWVEGEPPYLEVKALCRNCKSWRSTNISNFRKYGCPNCASSVRKTKEKHQEEIQGLGVECFEYRGQQHRNEYRCNTCAFEWSALGTNVTQNAKSEHPKNLCLQCRGYERNGGRVYVVPCGDRQVKVRGFERFAFDYLLRFFKPEEISPHLSPLCSEGNPYVEVGGKRHYPDFWIPKHSGFIEVKSIYTLGLVRTLVYGKKPQSIFANAKAKLEAAREEGFSYCILLVLSPSACVLLKRKDLDREQLIKRFA